MRILVTGGAGYVGSHVVLALLDAGHTVSVVDDFSTGSREALLSSVPIYAMDAGDRRLLDALLDERPDAVIHLAASASVADSFEHPDRYEANNVGVTARLAIMCSAAGVKKFVFSSTGAVYGHSTAPLDEGHPLSPLSPYGASKLKAERVLAAMSHRIDVVTLRYFNVAGADPALRAGQRNREMGRLVDVVAEVICGDREAVGINGADYPTPDGTAIRDYIHVSDVADAHVAAVKYLASGGAPTTLNVGYGVGHSVFEVLKAAEEVAGHSIPFSVGRRRPGDPCFSVADPTAIGRVLGFRTTPSFDGVSALERMIRDAVAWRRHLRG